jgi:peptidoglycan hydrolase-like protein with peptidoglycan-binding domain
LNLLVSLALLAGMIGAAAPTSAQTDGESSSSTAKKTTTHHHSTHHKTKGKKKSSASWKTHGQQKPDTQRTQAIQEALQREHYLSQEPTGVWDSQTQAAMEKYQADHGWQSKSVPDSRALIKLGLGPDHEHLLNPQTAMTTDTVSAVHTNSPSPASSAPGSSPATTPASSSR